MVPLSHPLSRLTEEILEATKIMKILTDKFDGCICILLSETVDDIGMVLRIM